ncbi:MAG: hypothetical protein APF80_11910 [Alphaproteobacteria bacterium BRH_c36]|nr:MAG: hypothetical protein APF80_11910 [Alphaproteobacteria bacterium BRH_c36]
MKPTLTPKHIPKLGPTPLPIPQIQTYLVGDFMRAFGIEENIIQIAQAGYQNRDFIGITVAGLDSANVPRDETSLVFDDIVRDGTLMIDTASKVSVTEQLSKRLAAAMSHSATALRRRGLSVHYSYILSAKGHADYQGVLSRYGLTPGAPNQLPPGTAMRTIYEVTHSPTGSRLTHKSLRKVR